jgi:GrpB-like predicted nucleotidyltransferase (UPF0157 family)
LKRHPSLDDRFDPAIRIVDYDPAWPDLAAAGIARIKGKLGDIACSVRGGDRSDRSGTNR